MLSFLLSIAFTSYSLGVLTEQDFVEKQDTKLDDAVAGVLKSRGSGSFKSVNPIFDITPYIKTPDYKEPDFNFKPPKTPILPIMIDFPFGKKKKKKDELKKLLGEQYAILPDFSARALGLKPRELTVKQAEKEVRKLISGLGVRRGVKIKF